MKISNVLVPLFLFVLFSVSSGLAVEENSGDKPPGLDARFVVSGPVIDGNPTDPIWNQAIPDSSFHLIDKPGVSSNLTTIKALYDDTSLYLLYTCRGKPAGEILAMSIARDVALWETDDEVEFYLYPGLQDTCYIQFVTNAIGAKYDMFMPRMILYKDFVWTAMPGWFDDHWITEIEIPLRQFAEGVKDGEVWKANFARYHRTHPDSATIMSWSPMTGSLHKTELFGQIRFERGTTFKESPLEISWTGDESLALANLKKLKGKDGYEARKDYFDNVLTYRHNNRPFEFLQKGIIDFATEYPDSEASFELALKLIYPSASLYRMPPETVDAFVDEISSIIKIKPYWRNLISLSRGLYYNETGQREKWIQIYREMSTKEPPLAATATYLLLLRTGFEKEPSKEEQALIEDALWKFADLVFQKSTPIHIPKGANWICLSPTEEDRDKRINMTFRRTLRYLPETILAVLDSMKRSGNLSEELNQNLLKTEYEIYSNRNIPLFSTQKADSLIQVIASFDEEYAEMRLNGLLRDRVRDLDVAYTAMGRDSLPRVFRETIALRKHYPKEHPIDMVFASVYENIDSLDTAIAYLQRYNSSLSEERQRRGPVARYLGELVFRREHRNEPGYHSIPRNAFRFVYRTRGYKAAPDFLDIQSDGKVVLYPSAPDTLDPRLELSTTVQAGIDSPAVAFRISKEEVDSLHSLLTRYGFLDFKLKYTEECRECGDTEMTLMTPWNVRTTHLEGENLSLPAFKLEKDIRTILDKYLPSVYYFRPNWHELYGYFEKWGEYNTPGISKNKQLDTLLELFNMELREWSWLSEDWYTEPLLELARDTGRESEIYGVIGLKYFDSIFKWDQYVRERAPKRETERMVEARNYLSKAAEMSRKESEREWYRYLIDFSNNYSGDIDRLIAEADELTDGKNRADAILLLIWLSCANEDHDRAGELYTKLNGSKAKKEQKYLATLRMMVFNRDQDRNEEGYGYLTTIEKEYMGLLPKERERPIYALDEYARIDLVLDKAYFLYHLGDPRSATEIVQSVKESDLPEDRVRKYKDLQLLASALETPSEYDEREFRQYIEILSALGRFRQYELTALWGMWLMDNNRDPKIRSQLAGAVAGAFERRETWDELQKKIARNVLEETRAGMPVKGGDPTGQFLGMVIEHGTTEDVVSFWRGEIQPHRIEPSSIQAIDRLVAYLTDAGEEDEVRQVLEKTIRELPREATDIPLSELILIKYSIDLADLYAGNPNWEGKGTALIDSLKAGLKGLSRESYPFAFIAIADWKARHSGWEAMVEFVSPFGDSLIKAEQELPVNIYDPPLIPGTSVASPLLALRCVQPERQIFQFESDFLEVLGISSEAADPVLKILRRSPARLDLDCSQAQLLNWKTDSFEAILKKYAEKHR